MPASAWNGLCNESCGDARLSTVALVDSGALHSFVSAELVSKGVTWKSHLLMEVRWKCHRHVVFLWLYTLGITMTLHCTVYCIVLPHLNHDILLGVDWLQSTNPSINR